MNNMFEYAVRNKLRFPFKGMITVEDLYDLSLSNLDVVFKTLNKQVKQSSEESLLTSKSKEDEVLDIQINIVKHIFNVKNEEAIARLKEKENKEKKQRLLEIKHQKEDEALHNMSLEELDRMIKELD